MEINLESRITNELVEKAKKGETHLFYVYAVDKYMSKDMANTFCWSVDESRPCSFDDARFFFERQYRIVDLRKPEEYKVYMDFDNLKKYIENQGVNGINVPRDEESENKKDILYQSSDMIYVMTCLSDEEVNILKK